MTTKSITTIATTLALAFAGSAFAADAVDTAEHNAHHSSDTTAATKLPTDKAKAATSKAAPAIATMDAKIQAMQAMHEKMVAAKTSEERNALMSEHMKTMQDAMGSMGMMGGMGGKGGMEMGMGSGMQGQMPPDMATRQQLMEKRMDMMGSMMQMMMDRMPSVPATK